MTTTDCAYADSDTPSRYVAGTLSPEEAENFEEHYFSCSRCWQEVQTGTVARGVLTDAQRRPASRQRAWWMSVAAAAVIAVVSLVVIRNRDLRDRPDVLRGEAEHTIAVVAERAAGQLQVRWRAVTRASRYAISVQSAEGEVLQEKSSTATTIVLHSPPGHDVFVRVTAYDAEGEEIARSPLVRVSSR